MKNVKRVMTLGCVVLLVMANVCGCGMQAQAVEQTEEENNLKELQNAVEELAGNSDIVRHSSTAGKEETVYAILDAGGNPVETIVSEWLKKNLQRLILMRICEHCNQKLQVIGKDRRLRAI